MRRKITEKFGNNSRRSRKIFKILRQDAAREKSGYKEKYDQKLKYIGNKKEREKEEKLDMIPRGLEGYKNAKVFDKGKFDDLEIQSYEITVIGDVELSEEEKKVLRLHPKFALLQDLDMEDMELDIELGCAKLRYQIGRENEEKVVDASGNLIEEDISEEEEEKLIEIEAKSRQIFDPLTKSFDYRKKKVTDMKENARVTLPRPLGPLDEASIEIRREVQLKIMREHREKFCTEKGAQPSNLSKAEASGLKSLKILQGLRVAQAAVTERWP